jgi:hypothetical protein
MQERSESEEIFVWAAFADPSSIPGRLAVMVCTDCGAVYATSLAVAHAASHKSVEDRPSRT